MKVCLGGTFNLLHKGHKYLIDKAYEIAGEKGSVYIGISDGELLYKKKFVTPYEERVKAIQEYISSKGYNDVVIKKIYDRFGLAVSGDFDAIIVSPESISNSQDINKNRISIGKKPLKIIEIPYILADDKKPISSTRIYDKIIDKDGNVL